VAFDEARIFECSQRMLDGAGFASERRRDGALRGAALCDRSNYGVLERPVGQRALLRQEVVVLAEHGARRVEHASLQPAAEVAILAGVFTEIRSR
jgi:hypothetical protein